MIEETNEIWKTIEGYPNYQVSNKGRIKSIERKVKSRYGSIYTRKEKILKPQKDKDGYLMVNLYKENKMKTMKVHRLVAAAFVQNESLFNTDINHKNEIKSDNRAENLEFCTREYNNNFGTRNERNSKTSINDPKKSKAVICLETGVVYPSTKEVYRKLGFSYTHISACCRGEYKSAYKYHWQYV